MLLGDDETGDRPDRRIVDWRQNARARQPVLFRPGRHPAPADRLTVTTGDHARFYATFDQHFEEPAIILAPPGPEFPIRAIPEAAPAATRIAARAKQPLDLEPPIRRCRRAVDLPQHRCYPLCHLRE
jgi:hypothetical protein